MFDDITRFIGELAVRDRALELACSHADFGGENPEDCPLTLGLPCPRGYGKLCFDPSPDDCFAEAWMAQARAEVEAEDAEH